MQHESHCKLSNPARLLKALMAATGMSDAKELSDSLGIPVRTIQRLKLEIATAINGAPETANSAISGAAKCANDAISGVADAINGASGASRTHARKESPSGIYISSKCSEVVRERTDCAALPDRSSVEKSCRDAAGDALNCFAHGLHDISPIIGLLEGGADLDRDVVPAIRAKAATIRGGSISSWNFFVPVVSQAMTARKSASAVASKAKAARSDVDSYAKANGWRFETRPDGSLKAIQEAVA